ncbi:1873_t:CDS:1, partial [Gigaspora margarita]
IDIEKSCWKYVLRKCIVVLGKMVSKKGNVIEREIVIGEVIVVEVIFG